MVYRYVKAESSLRADGTLAGKAAADHEPVAYRTGRETRSWRHV
jgi:hypothetical protein